MIYPSSFYMKFVAMCQRRKVSPQNLLMVAMNESGVNPASHNPNGHASGLWQLMPATARGLGWDFTDRDLSKFRQLSAEEQLPWFERYYAPHTGKLVSTAACYVCTFLPADLDLAANPDAVLVQKDGRRGWAYSVNASFDINNDMKIQVHELDDAIRRACSGPRWATIAAELAAVTGGPVVVSSPHKFDLSVTLGIQQALNYLGFPVGSEDGAPGVQTRAGVMAFQKSVGLNPDAIPGPKTRAALTTALVSRGIA